MKVLSICVLALLATAIIQDAAIGYEYEDYPDVAIVEDSEATILAFPAAAMPNVFLAGVACAFYREYGDDYDALFVFNNSLTNIQQGWSVQNTNEGIGRPLFNSTANFCASKGRLRITVNMGNINTLPPNPNDTARIVPFYPLTGLELQGHEFGHHWLAAVTFDKQDGEGRQCLIRGYEPSGEGEAGDCNGYNPNDFNQHWSYDFNSCSLMYGSCIEEVEPGLFEYSYPAQAVRYSQLDQYLMGLRSAEEVDPLFLVRRYWDDGSLDLAGTSSIPLQHDSSAQHEGERVDFTVDDIIRAEGSRNPEFDSCHWKAAFIIVHPVGQSPTSLHVQQVDAYRSGWESFYDWATDNRGSFDTSLKGCGTGTESCPGEQSERCNEDPPECRQGERRCNGPGEAEICRQGSWLHLEDCPESHPCMDGECGIENSDGDIPDGDTPDGDTPDGDTPDGDILDGNTPDGDTSDDIPDGNTTDGDMLDGDADYSGICTPRAKRCEGSILQTCNENGSGWIAIDCAKSAMECDSLEGCVAADASGCNGSSSPVAGWCWLFAFFMLLVARSCKTPSKGKFIR